MGSFSLKACERSLDFSKPSTKLHVNQWLLVPLRAGLKTNGLSTASGVQSAAAAVYLEHQAAIEVAAAVLAATAARRAAARRERRMTRRSSSVRPPQTP